MDLNLVDIKRETISWNKITKEGLDVDYTVLFPKNIADHLMKNLEENIEYNSSEQSKVRVFGKWYDIPRQQVAYGDKGTNYSFSGITVPSKSWNSTLLLIKNILLEVTGYNFNFVLVNRYRNGSDHIGEHKDSEPDLDPLAPIASISFGQNRDFVLKHEDARKKIDKRNIPVVKINLEHGSLLMMNAPTNKIWYHSLPPRKSANGIRINLTFRCIKNVK